MSDWRPSNCDLLLHYSRDCSFMTCTVGLDKGYSTAGLGKGYFTGPREPMLIQSIPRARSQSPGFSWKQHQVFPRKSFLRARTEERVVGPCWEKLKPEGPKAPKGSSSLGPTCKLSDTIVYEPQTQRRSHWVCGSRCASSHVALCLET